jgi:hypothetical protein
MVKFYPFDSGVVRSLVAARRRAVAADAIGLGDADLDVAFKATGECLMSIRSMRT